MTSCFALLLGLSFLQIKQLDFFLYQTTDVLQTHYFRFWLILVPISFYFFSRSILLPEEKLSPVMLLHLIPLLLNFLDTAEIAISISFAIGTGYCLWFANIIYGFKTQRKRLKFEIFFFGLFSVIAVLVLVLGFSAPYINIKYFYWIYTSSIGVCFALIVTALMIFPELLSDLSEVAKLSYASSTLTDVDKKGCLGKLEKLMVQEKMYQNDKLNLAMVAEATELSGHQLSELINVEFAVNFSRYIRGQRVEAAKDLLLKEPDSSVLAIGLEIGFKSQSNFYAAFKEITGMSPGAYRKNGIGPDPKILR